jgi:hypothetical protein
MYKSYKFDTTYMFDKIHTTYKIHTSYKTDTIWIFFTSERNRHGEHSKQNSVS